MKLVLLLLLALSSSLLLFFGSASGAGTPFIRIAIAEETFNKLFKFELMPLLIDVIINHDQIELTNSLNASFGDTEVIFKNVSLTNFSEILQDQIQAVLTKDGLSLSVFLQFNIDWTLCWNQSSIFGGNGVVIAPNGGVGVVVGSDSKGCVSNFTQTSLNATFLIVMKSYNGTPYLEFPEHVVRSIETVPIQYPLPDSLQHLPNDSLVPLFIQNISSVIFALFGKPFMRDVINPYWKELEIALFPHLPSLVLNFNLTSDPDPSSEKFLIIELLGHLSVNFEPCQDVTPLPPFSHNESELIVVEVSRSLIDCVVSQLSQTVPTLFDSRISFSLDLNRPNFGYTPGIFSILNISIDLSFEINMGPSSLPPFLNLLGNFSTHLFVDSSQLPNGTTIYYGLSHNNLTLNLKSSSDSIPDRYKNQVQPAIQKIIQTLPQGYNLAFNFQQYSFFTRHISVHYSIYPGSIQVIIQLSI